MNNKRKLPYIGMRIVKSAVGVFLCFVIYILRGEQGIPFYSALAVLWCIQNYTKNTFSNAFQRTVGTIIGALYGLIFLTCSMYVVDLRGTIWHYVVLSAMIVPVIRTAVFFHKKNAAYFSCVVFLSIAVNHVGDENPYLFVWNRTLDTMIGILLGLVINSIHFRRTRRKDTLFVADLDNVLQAAGDHLTAYSSISIKNLLEDGMNLTFMTFHTPAVYLDRMSDVHPSLPIIAMDGAVLYDVNENAFRKSYIISADNARGLETFFRERGFHVFSNVIIDDVLIIYYEELKNSAEKKIYEELHKSPYRNYLNRPRPEAYPVVYFMVVDETEKIQSLCDALRETGAFDRFKILCYASEDYPGYSYIKIYNKNASVEKMLYYLEEMSGLKHTVTVGDDQSRYSVRHAEQDSTQIVRRLNRLYYW